MFSDGVLAIIITLLVLELHVPEVESGHLLEGLLEQWPTYVAYTISYLYVAIVWLNHRSVFMRIRVMDRGLHWANMGVLFTTALLPFTTAVLARALELGDAEDIRTAVGLYGLIAIVGSLSWLVLFHYLGTHPQLLDRDASATFFATQRLSALAGVPLNGVAMLVGYVLEPVLALLLFLTWPALWALRDEGPFEKVARRRSGT